MKETTNCANCSMRKKYDENPKSLLGRFWRFHILFCPGWKQYVKTLSQEEYAELKVHYNLK